MSTIVSHTPASPLTRVAELTTTYGLAAYVLCLPLEFTTTIFRQPLSRFIIVALAAAYIYLMVVRRRTLQLPWHPSVWLLLAFVIAALVSWSLTRLPYSRNSLLDIALYPVVGILILNLALSEEDHRRAWTAFLVSGLIVSVAGIFLYVTGLHLWTPNPLVANRLNITFADPNITARFLTLGACAAVLMFSARKAPAWLAIATAIGCAITLPMTWSRSGLALFILCTVVAAVMALDRRRALAIAAVALLAFAISTAVNPDTRDRAAGAVSTVVTVVTGGHVDSASAIPGNEDVSLADNRVYLVAAGWKMFIDHPVFGVGFGGFQDAMLHAYRSFLPQGYTDSVSHTSLVTVLAEGGLIGLALLLAFLVLLAREALVARARRDDWAFWSTLPATLIIPIFLYSQFEARFFQEPYLWLALGLYYSARMLARRASATVPALDAHRRVIAAA